MPDIPMTPRLDGARLVIGGTAGLESMVQVADTATRTLDVDLFAGSHKATLDGLSRGRDGIDTLFLADPEVSTEIRSTLDSRGVTVVDNGVMPVKNHAKSVVADGERAVVTTAALAKKTPLRFEVGAAFDGPAARAMSELTRATATADTPAIQAAAARAQQFGIVVNDPQHGVWHLTEEVRGMVDGARERLVIATKRLEEPGIMRSIEEAKRRGVDVTVARKVGAGDMPLHANIVIADDAAYVGSGHLTKRVLTGGGSNGRISRELGVMIEQPALVAELTESLRSQGFIGPKPGSPVAAVERVAGARGGTKLIAGAIGAAVLASVIGVALVRRGGDE